MAINYDDLSDLPLRSGDAEALDWEEVKEDSLWDPPEQWWESWGNAEILYRVDIDLPGEALAVEVWDELTAEYATENDVLLCGGASVERLTDTTYRVVSGGEDGLDSLTHAVNDVVLSTVERLQPGADWAIIEQTREEE